MRKTCILLTGSNAGFGRLAVLRLAQQGHHVIATMRDLSKGESLLEDCKAQGLTIEIRQLDVCDPASVAAALEDAASIDVLVNNAGFEVQGALELVSDELMHRQLNTNVLGPLRTIRTVMSAWRQRGSGAIINVSSVVGRMASPYGGAYAASKFALEGMSEALHFEVAPAGIRVHLIEPGRFSTTSFGSNIIRPEGWEATAHYKLQQTFAAALGSLDDGKGPQNPQLVADAIAQAATDTASPFRIPVGDDAAILLSAQKAAGSFEEFEMGIRAQLNWYT
jgi:NAD(P)-dependent dehydrogenase (short-subunit alcohol dehydrogenase family)